MLFFIDDVSFRRLFCVRIRHLCLMDCVYNESLWDQVWILIVLKDHKCYSMFDLNSRPD